MVLDLITASLIPLTNPDIAEVGVAFIDEDTDVLGREEFVHSHQFWSHFSMSPALIPTSDFQGDTAC